MITGKVIKRKAYKNSHFLPGQTHETIMGFFHPEVNRPLAE